MTYYTDPIEAVVSRGTLEHLARLLEAGNAPAHSPQTGANEAKIASPPAG
jgi:hypothetical protein